MNKYNVGFSIKLPIPGVQYSNIDARFDWEEETEDGLEVVMKRVDEQAKLIRSWLDAQGKDLEGIYKTRIEELEAKLTKAREEFIKLKSN